MCTKLSSLIASLLVVTLIVVIPSPPARAADGPGNYTVDSSADALDPIPGDNICGQPAVAGTCTLRAALQESDGDGLMSTITFKYPMTITLDSALGPLIEYQDHNSTYIDASNLWQGTWPGGKPGVSIDGAMMVLLQINGNWVYVRGIEFVTGGILINGGKNNWIGDTDPRMRNVFLSPFVGVSLQKRSNYSPTLNRIRGNYFGTEDGGTPSSSPAYTAIVLGAGTDHATVEGNIIMNVRASANSAAIMLSGSDSNTIKGNVIGLNGATTAAYPNSYGILLEDSDYNTIGPANVIAGNNADGIYLTGTSEHNTIVEDTIGKSGLGNGGHGVHLKAGPSNSVNGCSIVGNIGNGVYLETGTQTTVSANVIGSNIGHGVYYLYGMGNTSANYIGMDRSGAAMGNGGYGIKVESGGNIIGGLDASSVQWVGNNAFGGIYLKGPLAKDCTVTNNMVGVTPGGAKAANGNHGISAYDAGSGIYIGAIPSGNVVMGASWSGIVLVNTSGANVIGNKVGTNGAGANFGNAYYGITVVNGSGNTIRRNEVAFSGRNAGEEGIRIQGATANANRLTENSLHDNGGAGIALVDGGNASLAAPVIKSVNCSGQVSGTACAGCTVEIFADNQDEARTYLGTTTANASGAWSFTGPAGGPFITATATDSSGNTSSLSAPVRSCRRMYLPLVSRR